LCRKHTPAIKCGWKSTGHTSPDCVVRQTHVSNDARGMGVRVDEGVWGLDDFVGHCSFQVASLPASHASSSHRASVTGSGSQARINQAAQSTYWIAKTRPTYGQ
jgi:hypothetical protein